MTFVNEDVVERVLNSCDTWYRKDLCTITLISSAWVNPVRKRLYPHPALCTYKSCHHLARTLEENPALIPLIRTLDLRPTDETEFFHEDLKKHTAHSCRGPTRLLELTCLECLILGGDLTLSAERCLYGVGSPHTIKSLHIRSPSLLGGRIVRLGSLIWDEDLPLRFHSLESLSVDGPLKLYINDNRYVRTYMPGDFSKTDTHDSTAATVPRGCILKELHLRGVESFHRSGSICALLYEPAAWRNLRRLTFTFKNHGPREDKGLARILRLSTGSLEDIVFESTGEEPDLVSPYIHMPLYLSDSPELLLRLKSLKTSWLFIYHEHMRFIVSNVEVLDIDGASEESILEWVRDIQSGGFPRLGKMVLRIAEFQAAAISRNHEFHNAIYLLATTCKGHGAELTVLVLNSGNPRPIS